MQLESSEGLDSTSTYPKWNLTFHFSAGKTSTTVFVKFFGILYNGKKTYIKGV